MTESAMLIAVFALGLALGVTVAWLLLPASRQSRNLHDELQETKAALKNYRDDVDSHFLHTAELVNSMTQSYLAVHEHLSDGARKLCSEQGRRQAVAKSLEQAPPSAQDFGRAAHAPLDYAPSHKGTLAEDYGLHPQPPSSFVPLTEAPTLDAGDDDTVAPPRDYADGCDAQGCPEDETQAARS